MRGLLIAVQSLCLYSAVAHIPVALGGLRPTRRSSAIMGLILVGLILLVLDFPGRMTEPGGQDPQW